MNFLADEGVDGLIVKKLREDGHDVLYVAEQKSGTSDETVLVTVNREARILITRDKDFGELEYHKRQVPWNCTQSTL